MEDNLSIAEVNRIVDDLRAPRMAVYWADFLASITIGGACFFGVRVTPLFSPQQILCFIVSGLFFYRAVIFNHELVHMTHDNASLRRFRVFWNLSCGIPFLMPSFTYWTHWDHHSSSHYGTPSDGEYLRFAAGPPLRIVKYLAACFVIPIFAVIRFFILTPLGWFSGRLRKAIYKRASSLVINPSYIRPEPTAPQERIIRWQELACFLWCTFIFLVLPFIVNRWPWPFWLRIYLLAVFVMLLNAFRTLGAHRYRNDGQPTGFTQQVLDSVNYPYLGWIHEFLAPVGLRYHAMHHLQSTLPYHALPEAHRRLMRELPEDSVYRSTVEFSLISVLTDLWRQATSAARKNNKRF
jgi:fatty acid desaturase